MGRPIQEGCVACYFPRYSPDAEDRIQKLSLLRFLEYNIIHYIQEWTEKKGTMLRGCISNVDAT
jgi:hypothetical protein